MYVHLGGELSLSDKWIVGIFDLDQLTESARDENLHFLRNAEAVEKLENLGGNLPRSIILGMDRVYLSPLSVRTLEERIHSVTYVNDKQAKGG